MPIVADQFGPFAYLGALLLVAPLAYLERKPNLRRTFAVLSLGALLSLSTSLIFGLSDFGRLSLVVELILLYYLLPSAD